ncbi:DNA polymerase III subunit delta [Chloroflexota bacterium]
MLYILSGEDDFSLHRALGDIKSGLGDQALLSANTTTLDGQQLSLEQLQTVCETMPFLAERRLVIVRGLLQRFAPQAKSRRQRKITRETSQQDESSLLAAHLHHLPDSTVLVLVDGRIAGNNPLLREISAGAVVMTFPLLRDAKLKQWIKQQVAEDGGIISPPAVDSLARLVGSNLWMMTNEINKLVLFTSGRGIEEADVQLVISDGQESSVFAMVDTIFEFKTKVAEQQLQQLLQKGAAPAYLMVMLSRQIQLIVRAKELRSQGKSDAEIQHKLGLNSEWALRKTLEQAARYSPERLKSAYHKLLETDVSIKTGKRDGELALTILVAELCQRR